MKANFILLLGLLLTSMNVFGQVQPKTDRLPEIESELRVEIVEYVARYIPKSSFTVSVKLNPLRRVPQTAANVDILPFYETSEDAILDEWDNPESNYYTLLNRIQDAQVSITIDGNYNIKNEAEFRDNLFKSVGLLSGRDRLEMRVSDLKAFEKKFSTNDINWVYVLVGFLGIFTLGLMYFGINRFTDVHKKAQSLAASKESSNSNVSSSSSMPSQSAIVGNGSGKVGGFGENSKINGDINFTDSLKINNYLKEKIEYIVNQSEKFPLLADLKTLEDLLAKDTYGFSYLISQFNQEKKELLFSLGRSQDWIKGFAEVGIPSKEILFYLEKMIHSSRNTLLNGNEQLITQCWRLNSQLKDFITTIPRGDVKLILYLLPKELSLPLAREMFPGDWAFILADKAPNVVFSEARSKELLEQALSFKPYFDPKMIQTYRNKEELVNYLHSCTPDEEKEIYQSIDSTHSLSIVRPPFYVFFDLDQEERTQVFRHYDLRTWSLACFNMSRNMRSRLDELMNDKEKYLFKSYLTDLDKNKPHASIISEIREIISREVAQIISLQKSSVIADTNNSTSLESNDQAA